MFLHFPPPLLSSSLFFHLQRSQELDDKNALNILLCSVKIPSSYASADNDKRFEMMNPAKKHSIVLQVLYFLYRNTKERKKEKDKRKTIQKLILR
jgi:hypothetical protein